MLIEGASADELDELVKEVFALFGAAYYYSEVLHRGLCIVAAVLTFQNKDDITRPRLEEKLSRAFSQTLGEIVRDTKPLLPIELRQGLELALDRRNFLAHRFWFERCHLMVSRQGLTEMQSELLDLRDVFGRADDGITRHFASRLNAFGLTDELLEKQLEKLIRGELEGPLMSQRPPRKQERIVRAWDVTDGDGLITQVFETEDGCLWQLCDVGLGWTRFKQVAPDWLSNDRIQAHLPASVDPRPLNCQPWHYEFRLAKGAVLRVMPGKGERSYRWSLRLPNPSRLSR